jgi:hypothetical protein
LNSMVFSSQNKNLKNVGAPLSLPRINIKKIYTS